MVAPKASQDVDVRALGDALPSPQRNLRRRARPTAKPRPEILPSCFDEIWRRRGSNNPAHRRERATLEAIVSTIPRDATELTGQSGAAVYLAALVLSLQRFLDSNAPLRSRESEEPTEKRLSKKERKKLRKQEREREDAVKDMSAAEALGAKAEGREPMNVDDGKEAKGSDNVEFIANLVYLIALAARGSSQTILKAKCEVIVKVVMDAYDHVAGAPSVARHCSPALAAVFVVLDSSSWSKPTIQRAYLYMLRLTCNVDSRARRKARDELEVLLKSPRGGIIRGRTSSSAAAHFISEMRLQFSGLDNAVNGDELVKDSVDRVGFVYLLTSIERFARYFEPLDAARVTKELVLIAVKGLPDVTLFAYEGIDALFRSNPEGLENNEEKMESEKCPSLLPQGDLGKLLQALLKHDLVDNVSEEVRIAFNSCIASGAVAYASYYSHTLPPNEFVLGPVEKLCECLATVGNRANVIKSTCRFLQFMLSESAFQANPAVLSKLQSLAAISFRHMWPDTLRLLQGYLDSKLAARNMRLRENVIALVKEWKETYERSVKGKDAKLQEAARNVLLAVVRGGGAEYVLDIVELRYDSKVHVTNAWILPILHDGLRGAPLSLFASKLVPLADKLHETMVEKKNQHRAVESKNLGIYYIQIWGLLPGFCQSPSDLGHAGVLTMAFKAIHKCLTHDSNNAVMSTGVTALRQLASSMQGLDGEDPTSAVKTESFGSRLKKLFPTIIDLTDKLPGDKRDPLLQSLTASCIATGDVSLVSSLLKKTIRRLLELQISLAKENDGNSDEMSRNWQDVVQKQHAAADLSIAIAESKMLPPDAEELTYLEKAMSPFFLDPRESVLQKKAFKATALLFEQGSMTKALGEVGPFARNIAEASSNVALGAKAMRLRLIKAFVNYQMDSNVNEERREYLKLLSDLFLTEVILCTRDAAEKTRAAAFDTLLTMARSWNVLSLRNSTDGLQQFFLSVAAGLGGKTVPMLAATLTSLGRLMYDFRGEASSDADLGKMVDSCFASRVPQSEMTDVGSKSESSEAIMVQPGPIAILLRHNAAEVQKSALGVVKIATKVLAQPISRLNEVLPGILPGLVHTAARSKKREIRVRVRIILERLLRKCGQELLEANFPQDHLKLLNAVRKQYSRDLVQKHAAKERRREALAKRDHAHMETHQDLNMSDADADFASDDSDSDVEHDLLDGDDMLRTSKRSGRSLHKASNVNERPGEVMDLLDVKNSHALSPDADVANATHHARKESKRKRENHSGDAIKYGDDGRPIFVESDDNSGGAELGSGEDESGADSDLGASGIRSGSAVMLGKKRRQGVQENERHRKKMKGSFGEEYRSRKGTGDVKRIGRPDPYAYVPLGPSMFQANVAGSSKGQKGKTGLQRLVGTKASRKRHRSLGVPGKR